MKKTISFFFILNTIFFSFFSQNINSNLISTMAINIKDVKDINIFLTYEEIEFSSIYGNEIVVDLYANNNHLLPSIDVTKDKESRGVLNIKTSTKGYSATKGDKCKIAVYIPQKVLFDNISFLSVNPFFSLSNINAKDALIMDKGISNGNINITNSKFSSLTVLSENSKVNIENTESEYLSIKTNSGNITLKNITSDYFDIITKTAFVSIFLKQVPLASSNINTTDGNIELFIPKR